VLAIKTPLGVLILLWLSNIKSNSQEQLDPHNGFMFTPTFDFLFDRGFMSFTNNKNTILVIE
jgi:hypothetical protein